jgi:aspartyl-tRNA(Asn)/glutamyl-tRNA(Gln) amidotransferase subunit A
MPTQLPSALTITEAAARLRDGTLTSQELTRALLDRAQAAQDTIAAFICFTEDSALEAAERADAELASGVDRGPLHGIPLAIKDIIATRDAPTTANSRVLDPAWGTREDATVVRKLREAGAVILGKLGLHEFAIGWPVPDTGFRTPKNPWDVSRTPGGSSSGTAAAIAAGLILGGLGTDTGGSIRGPAAYCGISGIKPSFGRVSKEGCVPLGYSLDNIGPMARTARDCALMLQVLAGFDPLDPCSVDAPVPNMTASLDGSFDGLRIGVPRGYFFDAPELETDVRQTVLNAIDAMAAAGASVVDVEIPHAAIARNAQRVIMFGEAYAYHEPDLQQRPELYGRYTRYQLRQGVLYSAADYVQAQRVRSLIKAETHLALSKVDVLVTPTALTVAPTFAGYDLDALLRMPSFMAIWNLTGLPALSVPCGFSSAGLPAGLQIIGKAFDEPTVFRVADAYQRVTDWHTRTPRQAAVA